MKYSFGFCSRIQFRYLEAIWCFWFSLCCVGWAPTAFNPWLISTQYWVNSLDVPCIWRTSYSGFCLWNMNYFQLCVITSGRSAYLFPGVFFQLMRLFLMSVWVFIQMKSWGKFSEGFWYPSVKLSLSGPARWILATLIFLNSVLCLLNSDARPDLEFPHGSFPKNRAGTILGIIFFPSFQGLLSWDAYHLGGKKCVLYTLDIFSLL